MSSQLSPFAFVERLLEAEEPIWYRWDKDVPALVDELIGAAHREAGRGQSDDFNARRRRYQRRRRIFWLLDRLLPKSEGARFEPFIAHDFALFAWGRRLGRKERHRLVDACLESVSDREHEPYMLAWCDSCPADELESLLDWAKAWEPALRAGVYFPLLTPSAEREFFDRCGDRVVRRAQLCAHLGASASRFREGAEFECRVARRSIHMSLRLLLKDTGARCPSEPIPESEEQWTNWLTRALATPEFAQVAEAAGEFLGWFGGLDAERQARWLWVYCHGANDWQKLHELALQCDDWFVYDHLADIMPGDRLEEWDTLVLWESEDHGQMRAFCRWLRPEYADVLRSHFGHSVPDWGACAYQAYLAKSPEPVLIHQWRRRQSLPGWQVKLLDRRLFAPETVRPGPVVEDIQDAEADFRLEDPFSRRGF